MTSPSTQQEQRRKCRQRRCERAAHARGYCQDHYNHRRVNRLPMPSTYTPFSPVMYPEIDEAAVQRLVAGDRVPHTSFERREAVRRLVAAGMPKAAVARHLGMKSDKQVYRDLAWLQRSAAGPSLTVVAS